MGKRRPEDRKDYLRGSLEFVTIISVITIHVHSLRQLQKCTNKPGGIAKILHIYHSTQDNILV